VPVACVLLGTGEWIHGLNTQWLLVDRVIAEYKVWGTCCDLLLFNILHTRKVACCKKYIWVVCC
jgi:hypothetical protein